MSYICVDLGSTNVKGAVFSKDIIELGSDSRPVKYERGELTCEFSPEAYYNSVEELITGCARIAREKNDPVDQIIFTGQAEALVLTDEKGDPIYNAISWMDMRSIKEAEELEEKIGSEKFRETTGMPKLSTIGPLSKIYWIRLHEPEVFARIGHILMIKDYIIYRLTGKFAGDYSIYSFTYYFDLRTNDYWDEMLELAGIKREWLPGLQEPCTIVDFITGEAAEKMGLPATARVNAGTNDHMAGMVGTGNVVPGIISESTGTTMAMALLLGGEITSYDYGIQCHHGPFPDSYMLLPVLESGGLALGWTMDVVETPGSYGDLNEKLAKAKRPGNLFFIPTLGGCNSPDLNPYAKGVIYGLRASSTGYDIALAAMEGLAYVLRANLDFLAEKGQKIDRVISTGGGAKSDVWLQIKADVLGREVSVPEVTDAPIFGCALIGYATEHGITDYKSVTDRFVKIKKQFLPKQHEEYCKKYELYQKLYADLGPAFKRDSE